MGLKKNNPGCNCCDTSTCINEDPTLFTGVEVTGIPTFSYTINGVTINSLDPDGIYLWSSVFSGPSGFPFCHSGLTPPTNYRLGTTYGPIQCCLAGWRTDSTEDNVDTGITFPYRASGVNYTAKIYIRAFKTFRLLLSYSSTNSVSYEMQSTMNICLWHDIPSGRTPDTITFLGVTGYIVGGDVYDPDATGTSFSDPSKCITGRTFGYTLSSTSVLNSGGFVVRPATHTVTATALSTSGNFEIDNYTYTFPGPPVFSSTSQFAESGSVTAGTVSVDVELLT